MRNTKKTIFILSLLFLGFQFNSNILFAKANPFSSGMKPAPIMPSIIIDGQGNIQPPIHSIQKIGNSYTLTDHITDYSLEIKCSNIIIDGAGFSLSTLNRTFAPDEGIIVHSNEVIIQDIAINDYEIAGILVLGDNNTIRENSFTDSAIKLSGNNNDVIQNSIHKRGVILGGNCNRILYNTLWGDGIFMVGSILGAAPKDMPNFSIIVGNSIIECGYADFAVHLSIGTHILYLNNFINNTNGNVSPYRWELTRNGEPAPKWSSDTSWMGIYPNDTIFDNGVLGNYWSDYEGLDANQDGIGEKHYVIGGNLRDHFPLMTPFDINNSNLDLIDWNSIYSDPSSEQLVDSSSSDFSIPITVSITTIVVCSLGIMTFLKKRQGEKLG